ncbi:uncharacterized protein LOC144763120 [Lissotriton helveticus]
MAESARLDGSELSANDISMWVQRAFCLLGNANASITHERRKGLLIKLDPKLANLAPMDPGSKANGLLFGENLVRDISHFVSTFVSLDKAQQSIKKTFAPRGRLKLFLPKWQSISVDPWVLNTVQGYLIEFYSPPVQTSFPPPLVFSTHMSHLISTEIQSLLQKRAIQTFPYDSTGFLSSSSLSGYQTHNILRRYSNPEFGQTGSPCRSPNHSMSSSGLGFPCKPREVFSGSLSEHGSCFRIRCQSIGLGRPLRSNLDWRSMVKRGVQTAHKLFRDACWFLCDQKSFQRQDPLFHTLTHGQCFCGSLHKSSRRNQVQAPSRLSEKCAVPDSQTHED